MSSTYTNGYNYASTCAIDAIDSLISEVTYLHNLTKDALAESDHLYAAQQEFEDRMTLLREVKKGVKHHLNCCKP